MSERSPVDRREFLKYAGAAVLLSRAADSFPRSAFGQAPAILPASDARPTAPLGVAAGDVGGGRAVVWSRANRAARMFVEYSTTDRFSDVRRVRGPAALESSDYTCRTVLTDLPAGQKIFYRVLFQDLSDLRVWSEPVGGAFATPASTPRDFTIAEALGRELEIAELLRHLKLHRVRNVVWITADVYYCAAHHYDPGRAKFTAFDPFWEFVAGPLHAGTFGPGKLDPTFGPEARFVGGATRYEAGTTAKRRVAVLRDVAAECATTDPDGAVARPERTRVVQS